MAAPAGPCEWCGGPQWWTFITGELYVMCKSGCLPLPLVGEVPGGSAGSAIEHGQVDRPQGSRYLTREGRETEAEAISIVGDYGEPPANP